MVTVLVKVARWGVDGVGLEFIFSDFMDHKGAATLSGTDMEALVQFMRGLNLPGNSAPQPVVVALTFEKEPQSASPP